MKIYVHSSGILSERSSNELCTFITEFVDNNVHLENGFHFVEVVDGYTFEFSSWLVSVLGVYIKSLHRDLDANPSTGTDTGCRHTVCRGCLSPNRLSNCFV